MTAPDRNRHHANLALDAGAPSTHDPSLVQDAIDDHQNALASGSQNEDIGAARRRARASGTRRLPFGHRREFSTIGPGQSV